MCEMTRQVIQLQVFKAKVLLLEQASGFSTVTLLKMRWVEQPQFAQLNVTF